MSDTITLFASEIAACIGRNQYQTPELATCRVWNRLRPDTFELACEARGIKSRTQNHVAQRAIDVTPLLAAHVADAKKASTPEDMKQSLQKVADVGRVLKTASATLSEAATVLVSSQALALAPAALQETIATVTESAKDLEVPAMHAIEALQKACDDETRVVSKPLPKIHSRKRAAIHQISIQQSKRRRVEAAEVCAKVLESTAQDLSEASGPRAMEAIAKAVYTERGQAEEPRILDAYQDEKKAAVNQRNGRTYSLGIEYSDHKGRIRRALVFGRVDGITTVGGEQRIVEVKHRQNRLFRFIPDYERVQIMTYMAMTGIKTADWVQRHGDAQESRPIRFDDEEWNRIVADIQSFLTPLSAIVDGEDATEMDRVLEAAAGDDRIIVL